MASYNLTSPFRQVTVLAGRNPYCTRLLSTLFNFSKLLCYNKKNYSKVQEYWIKIEMFSEVQQHNSLAK